MAERAMGLFDVLQRQHKFGAPGPIQQEICKDLKELERIVRCVIVSSSGMYRVSDLKKDYFSLTGRNFPVHNLGFSDAIEVLKSIPDACEILEDGSLDPCLRAQGVDKSAHIQRLTKSKPKSKAIKKENKSALNDVFVPFHVQDGIRHILFECRTNLIPQIFYEKLSSKYDLEDMGLSDVPISVLAQSLPHLMIYDGRFVKSAFTIDKSEVHVPESLHFPDEVIIPSYRLSKLERRISKNILELLEDNKYLNVGEIPHMYAYKFGKNLDWERLGFRDLWKFLALLLGNFKLVRTSGRYVLLHKDHDACGLFDIRERNATIFTGYKIQKMVLKEIRELSIQMNMGLQLNHLETSYEGFYHKKLVFKTNIQNFTRLLHDLKVFTLKTVNEINIIYPFSETDNEARNLRFLENPPISSELIYPEGVITPAEELKHIDFPKIINIYENIMCFAYVTGVENPNKFHLKIIGLVEESPWNELENKFKAMHTEMQQFYKLNYKELKIPCTHLRLDMVCAGCVHGQWQRVCIEDIAGPKGLMVKSIDYGSVHNLRLGSLRYLLKKFCSLPILAYKASLFNSRPIGPMWTIKGSKDFIRLTGDGFYRKPLVATIVSRNKEGMFQVALTDVSSKEDKHVDNQLQKLGHAALKFIGTPYQDLYS